MERGKIVIIEGTSCVGKTTLCQNLEKLGWYVVPEAIRYLEKETQKKGDEASPIPGSEEEELFYQDQLFRVELEKMIEANEISKKGINVVIDKSAIATIATAKAFEVEKGFKGTFRADCNKYLNMVRKLESLGLIEYDMFILLTADYNTILERNITRNHVLDGIWIDKMTIDSQRIVLEEIVFSFLKTNSDSLIRILDTTNLSKQEVLKRFNEYFEELSRKRGTKK